jgi:PTS system nitrogen regulatory IIA component
MASKDFNTDELAAYLHLTPPQVTKLATRGKLPGRRIGGQWKFSEPEIHHWLENQIGLSDEAELSSVERMLDRTAEPEEHEVRITSLLHESAIATPLKSRTRTSVIRGMCELASQTGLLWDVEAMAEAVAEREELHPTALENGVALLHPRRPQQSILAESFVALGLSSSPIPFGNRDGHLTDVFFLICSTDDRVHLRILARISRMIGDSVWLSELRACESPGAVLTHFENSPIEIPLEIDR